MRLLSILAVALSLTGCAHIQDDGTASDPMKQWHDAWVGSSKDALDLHPYFATQEMKTQTTDAGIEVRSYTSGSTSTVCTQAPQTFNHIGNSTYASGGFGACKSRFRGCNRVFYIKERKIAEVIATGECRTDPEVYPRNDLAGLAGNVPAGNGK